MKVSGYDDKRVVWEVIEDFFKELKENDEIGLRGFGFNFFMNMRGGEENIE